MKKPETTATFIMICIVALVAAYGLGYCINEIKASRIEAKQNKILRNEIKQLESYSPGNEIQNPANNFAQNRNARTDTGRDIQNRGMQNNNFMMGQGRPTNGNSDNQSTNNRGMSMFGNSSSMRMQNSDQQSMNNFAFFNNQYTPGSQEKVEEPNNSNQQGGY